MNNSRVPYDTPMGLFEAALPGQTRTDGYSTSPTPILLALRRRLFARPPHATSRMICKLAAIAKRPSQESSGHHRKIRPESGPPKGGPLSRRTSVNPKNASRTRKSESRGNPAAANPPTHSHDSITSSQGAQRAARFPPRSPPLQDPRLPRLRVAAPAAGARGATGGARCRRDHPPSSLP